jgi:hypothetical protein
LLYPVPVPSSGGSWAEPKPEEASEPPEAATMQEPTQERTPQLDWAGLLRRSFALDVFACVRCRGRLRVLAYLTVPSSAPPTLPRSSPPPWV